MPAVLTASAAACVRINARMAALVAGRVKTGIDRCADLLREPSRSSLHSGVIMKLPRYWTNACRTCALKSRCTTAVQRRITRWEHEHVLEAVQRRLDEDPQAMRRRRETVEHPFGTIKARMGATHFLMKTLPRVAAEMALHVLAYNLTRVINIVGPGRLIAAIQT
jgi:hypothetical protein